MDQNDPNQSPPAPANGAEEDKKPFPPIINRTAGGLEVTRTHRFDAISGETAKAILEGLDLGVNTKVCDLPNQGKGYLKSLKLTPFPGSLVLKLKYAPSVYSTDVNAVLDGCQQHAESLLDYILQVIAANDVEKNNPPPPSPTPPSNPRRNQ